MGTNLLVGPSRSVERYMLKHNRLRDISYTLHVTDFTCTERAPQTHSVCEEAEKIVERFYAIVLRLLYEKTSLLGHFFLTIDRHHKIKKANLADTVNFNMSSGCLLICWRFLQYA